MNEKIKEILVLQNYVNRYKNDEKAIINHSLLTTPLMLDYLEVKTLLDYITNLQQENEYLKLNNPEMNIEHFRIVNENKRKIDILRKQNIELKEENERLKDELEEEKRIEEADLKTIQRLEDENERLKEIINTYENPEDMTLFYMWLDTKAKDKLKQFENQIIMLKQQNQIITEFGEDYKSRCEKADNQLKIIMQIIKEQHTRNVEDDEWIENRLIGVVNTLQNGSEEK